MSVSRGHFCFTKRFRIPRHVRITPTNYRPAPFVAYMKHARQTRTAVIESQKKNTKDFLAQPAGPRNDSLSSELNDNEQ